MPSEEGYKKMRCCEWAACCVIMSKMTRVKIRIAPCFIWLVMIGGLEFAGNLIRVRNPSINITVI